jgi:hypothetical protein
MINVILDPNKQSMEDVRDALLALLKVPMDKFASLFKVAIHAHLADQER